MNGVLVFDIETGPLAEERLRELMPSFDPDAVKLGNLKDAEKIKVKVEAARAKHEADFFDKAALSAATGEVLAIGYRSDRVKIDGREECKLLLRFWEIFAKAAKQRKRMVGCNIFEFDLPFLVHRSWIHGVSVPAAVIEKDRYWHSVFVDIRARWQLGNRQIASGLGWIAKTLGVGNKPDDGITGKDFARLWKEDRERAEAYLKNDLDMTWQIAERMGIA